MPKAESKTTNPIRMFDRLNALRDQMAIHNPKSEGVEVLDWAIHVIEKISILKRQLHYLSGCFDG